MRYFNSIAIDGSKMMAMTIESLGWDAQTHAVQEAEQYELLVLELLLQLSQAKTGAAVFRAIQQVTRATNDILSQKIMQIQPFSDLSADKFNAQAKAENFATATPKGKKYYEKDPTDPLKSLKKKGVGGGSDTIVSFTPEHFVNKSGYTNLGMANCPANFEADETLLHEIVHGLRHMSGLRHKKPVPFQSGYDNIEEFFAILIANIYRSEQPVRTGLRLDHTLVFMEFTEDEFIRKGMNRSHLRQLRHEHHLLFSELRRIDVPFNPTRRILDI